MSYNKVDKCRGPFIFFIDIDMNQLGTLRYYMIVGITDMIQKNRKTKGFDKNLMKSTFTFHFLLLMLKKAFGNAKIEK